MTRTQKNRINYKYLVGIQNVIATLADSLAVSYKMKYAIILPPNSCTLGHLSQTNKSMFTQKPYIDVHSGVIHNSQKLESTQKSFKRFMFKQTWESCNRNTTGNKRVQTTDTCNNLDRSQGNHAE